MLPGLDCRDAKPTSDETPSQLTAAAPDLEHRIASPDSRDLARAVDELVGIRRTVAVVLSRDFVEHPAVTPCGSGPSHVRQP